MPLPRRGRRSGRETPSPLLQAMQEELTRSSSLLEEQPVAPYFLSYEITETQGINVRASFGFEDIRLKPPSGEIPKVPVSVHPYFDK